MQRAEYISLETKRMNAILVCQSSWMYGKNSIDEKRAALKDIFDAEMPPRWLNIAKKIGGESILLGD